MNEYQSLQSSYTGWTDGPVSSSKQGLRHSIHRKPIEKLSSNATLLGWLLTPVKSIAVLEDWHLILSQYIGWWRHVEFVAHKVGKQREQQQPAIPREVWLMKQCVASWFHSQSVAAWKQSFFFFFFFFLRQFQRDSEWSEFLRAENFRFKVPCEFWFQAAATTTTNSKCFWMRWISLEKYFRFRV